MFVFHFTIFLFIFLSTLVHGNRLGNDPFVMSQIFPFAQVEGLWQEVSLRVVANTGLNIMFHYRYRHWRCEVTFEKWASLQRRASLNSQRPDMRNVQE